VLEPVPPPTPPYMPSQPARKKAPWRTEQEANGVREYFGTLCADFGTFVPIRSRLVWRR